MEESTIYLLKQFNTNFKKLDISRTRSRGVGRNTVQGILDLERFETNLIELNCSNNRVTLLLNLPYKLKKLSCSSNQIVNLNIALNLTDRLVELDCSDNQLTRLDNLPLTLKKLTCSSNNSVRQFTWRITRIKLFK